MGVKFKRVAHTEKNKAIVRYLDAHCFEYDGSFPIYEDTLLWIGCFYDNRIYHILSGQKIKPLTWNRPNYSGNLDSPARPP